MTKIAVIGAGLAGLSAANLLQDAAEITVFEKARGVSGRMSTRQAGSYFFDHGAQYFTARTTPFREFMQPLIADGIVQRWDARYVLLHGEQIIERKNWLEDEPRYVGMPGMNAVVRHFANGMDIKINTRITSLQQEQSTWQLCDQKGDLYRGFDWVIATMPSPQVAALLPEAFTHHNTIAAVKMHACFALMLGFLQSLPLEFDAARVTNADISWLAVNSHKPGRADPFTLVVHSSEDYAAAHMDDEHEQVMQHLCAETSRITGCDVSIADHKAIHRWRYANNAQREHCPVCIDQELRLAACGDWCLGGRIENAFLSAYNLVNAMKEYI